MKFVLYAVQLGTAALLFLFSALASWYQGSELLKVPWEWKYTAKFTKLLYGEDSIKYAHDISQLDFFRLRGQAYAGNRNFNGCQFGVYHRFGGLSSHQNICKTKKRFERSIKNRFGSGEV